MSENIEKIVEGLIGADEAQTFCGPLADGGVRIIAGVIHEELVRAFGIDAIPSQRAENKERRRDKRDRIGRGWTRRSTVCGDFVQPSAISSRSASARRTRRSLE